MKKLVIGVLLITYLFSIAGCGSKADGFKSETFIETTDSTKREKTTEASTSLEEFETEPETIETLEDEITIDELEENYKQIYDNHTRLGIAIYNNYDNADYPYISGAFSYEENEIMILYVTNGDKNISYYEYYDKNTGELRSLSLNFTGLNNEEERSLFIALAASSVLIGEDLDTNITDGLYGALTEETDENLVVFNKYHEPVWVVQKMRFDDDVVFTSISIMRYDF